MDGFRRAFLIFNYLFLGNPHYHHRFFCLLSTHLFTYKPGIAVYLHSNTTSVAILANAIMK